MICYACTRMLSPVTGGEFARRSGDSERGRLSGMPSLVWFLRTQRPPRPLDTPLDIPLSPPTEVAPPFLGIPRCLTGWPPELPVRVADPSGPTGEGECVRSTSPPLPLAPCPPPPQLPPPLPPPPDRSGAAELLKKGQRREIEGTRGIAPSTRDGAGCEIPGRRKGGRERAFLARSRDGEHLPSCMMVRTLKRVNRTPETTIPKHWGRRPSREVTRNWLGTHDTSGRRTSDATMREAPHATPIFLPAVQASAGEYPLHKQRFFQHC